MQINTTHSHYYFLVSIYDGVIRPLYAVTIKSLSRSMKYHAIQYLKTLTCDSVVVASGQHPSIEGVIIKGYQWGMSVGWKSNLNITQPS